MTKTSVRQTRGSSLRAVVVPAAIFQIVLIGPGFSTGREVVEYAGQYGALGIWTILVVLIGFAALCAVAFEFARTTRAYNYRDYIRNLLGPLWPVFDVVWVAFTILVIGIVTSAVGETLSQVFGFPYLASVAGLLVCIALVLVFGRTVLERFEVGGSILFSVGIVIFASFILISRWEHLTAVLTTGDSSLAADASVGSALMSGVLYVAYNAATLIGVLFCLDRQHTRTQAGLSGVAASVLVVIPFGLTFLAVLSFYEPAVVNAEIPWLVLFERTGAGAFGPAFAFLLFVAVIATAAANLHAFLRRIDSARTDARRAALGPIPRGVVIAIILLASFLLSQIGIVALVAQGYTYFAYTFLLLFILPLCTRGIYLCVRSQGSPMEPAQGSSSAERSDVPDPPPGPPSTDRT